MNRLDAIWRGTATTRVSQGLYSVVRIDERPLAGYSGETRTYYLPVTLSNSSQILTPGSLGSEIPIINPVPNASCKKENSPVILHHDREERCERVHDGE
ncbi:MULTISPECIES: hypothetical protein [Bacillus cereus group]|uniref:hypothetical protein n=1 Tax=Bacillus cereus group TaxID=86661 RepID=UPI001298BF8A|nr:MULTISPECIES: hypothetical protein [Bacillus cereus group]MEB9327358.1 hypothetical protein [Bacillus cereus]MEB9914534.1 hypothetical protein [Bacillus cereus]MEC3239932.1 hypothetical protein [Bacillus cereus]MED2479171.1 hypothetical protein [Bacillus thuringiensis]MED2652885.1 hypothetical protein [Bacillus thuringiensis]